MTDEPFTLRNDPPRRRPDAPNDPERQRLLFAGLDCLPGQQDLFETEGDDGQTQD